MRVLASVYACSPYDGSERAVGWNWIKELDKYHEITALTSGVYRKDIEDYKKHNPSELRNTTFIYIDVPHTAWHVGYKYERFYYILWQKEALKIAKQLIKEKEYDIVHHITYVTCILPTYMHKLKIPFLYGPVSGGENIPSIIRYPMDNRSKIIEEIRSVSQLFFRMTPNFHATMKKASSIIVTTEETKQIIGKKHRDKVKIFQSIGLREDMFFPEPKLKPERVARFLVAGRMLYWKGFELAIRSFINAVENGCRAELVILGNTENNAVYEEHCNNLKRICGTYLNKEIKFVDKIEHSQMKEFYDGFDVILNCSLRDSGCLVVMEGMSRGLPVICVNTGGPKVNTTELSAIKIDPKSMKQMIEEISKAIDKLASDKELREKMGSAARKYAYSEFLISERTKKMNEFYTEVVR